MTLIIIQYAVLKGVKKKIKAHTIYTRKELKLGGQQLQANQTHQQNLVHLVGELEQVLK